MDIEDVAHVRVAAVGRVAETGTEVGGFRDLVCWLRSASVICGFDSPTQGGRQKFGKLLARQPGRVNSGLR